MQKTTRPRYANRDKTRTLHFRRMQLYDWRHNWPTFTDVDDDDDSVGPVSQPAAAQRCRCCLLLHYLYGQSENRRKMQKNNFPVRFIGIVRFRLIFFSRTFCVWMLLRINTKKLYRPSNKSNGFSINRSRFDPKLRRTFRNIFFRAIIGLPKDKNGIESQRPRPIHWLLRLKSIILWTNY